MPLFPCCSTDYLRYWQLGSPPFLHNDPNRFFSGRPQRAAITGISQFVATGKPDAILTSQRGCGMSRLLQHMSLYTGIGDHAVRIVLASSRPVPEKNVQTLWLADRGHLKSPGLTHLPAAMSTVFGTTEHAEPATTLRVDRETPTIRLAAMSLNDAFDYTEFAIRMAGGTRTIITESAVLRLHAASQGRIRDFARIAESALRHAWSKRAIEVDQSIIDEIRTPLQSAA